MISWLKHWYRFLNPKFQSIHLDYPVQFKPRFTPESRPHPQLERLISSNIGVYQELLTKMLEHKVAFSNWCHEAESTDSSKPSWENGFLPALDMMALYTMISYFKPNVYLEIGSGHSTKVSHCSKVDHSLSTKIISIDPQPRAMIDTLSDEVIRKKLEDVDVETLVDRLHTGDVLFIDNSHRMLPNSDATIVFTEILPRLNKGVIVHLHDIYLPYDYPQFMCDRYYSEQYGLAIAILANPNRYKTILPSFYISEHKELSQLIAPIWALDKLNHGERHGGSYWLQIDD